MLFRSLGIPSMFCKCPVCENARKVKGKELRSRSGFILDEKVAIDFSADSYMNMVRNDVCFGSIKHLLVTHSHDDHFYPYDLAYRDSLARASYPGIEKKLNIYGNSAVLKRLRDVEFFGENVLATVNLIEIARDQVFYMDDYKVTTFYAKHMFTEDSLVFLIERNGQAYLHLLDSPEPPKEFYDYLVKHEVKLDAVTADCTFGTMEEEFGGHMQMRQNTRVKGKLTELGILKKNASYFLTHFSEYNGKDTHEILCEEAKKRNMIVAYDGFTAEF